MTLYVATVFQLVPVAFPISLALWKNAAYSVTLFDPASGDNLVVTDIVTQKVQQVR